MRQGTKVVIELEATSCRGSRVFGTGHAASLHVAASRAMVDLLIKLGPTRGRVRAEIPLTIVMRDFVTAPAPAGGRDVF